MITVISLGGSIVAPDAIDTEYISGFCSMIRDFLQKDESRKVILIVGGGGPARRYQAAYRSLKNDPSDDDQDWIGIMATRLNAELIRAVFSPECQDPVITNPEANFSFSGSVLVAAGWKPGFSTDFDAVMLAERFGAKRILNLSNIEKVYTSDPKTDPDARPLDAISWEDFVEMVGSCWTPGKNTPFDPIASAKARKMGLTVLATGGSKLENVAAALEGQAFT
ncbi:MAG: UMP kinase, partial [Spirochaetaceae bacterium]